jgi:hypothetical protein
VDASEVAIRTMRKRFASHDVLFESAAPREVGS